MRELTPIQHLRNRMRVALTALRLKMLARSTSQPVVSYGWIDLAYSNDGDLQELYYHASQHDWHRDDLPLFAPHLWPGASVVDVGANIGFLSVLLASLVGPTGRVYAFEPAARTFEKLERTIALNHLEHVIVPIRKACGSAAGTLPLYTLSRSSGKSSLLNRESRGRMPETVEVVPLDAIPELRRQRIALIKTDTEGYESEVLLGARELIAHSKPAIVIELSGEYAASTQRAVDLLDEYGYDVALPGGIDWRKVPGGVNFIALPRVPYQPTDDPTTQLRPRTP